MTPSTMTAAVVARQGAADFALETYPIPTPGPGQILIRVEASGVNFSDVKRRRGDAYPFPTAFPFVPGGEVAGIVVAHGPGVDAPPVGERAPTRRPPCPCLMRLALMPQARSWSQAPRRG